MIDLDYMGRAFTHYLYMLRQAVPNIAEVPWDTEVRDSARTAMRSFEEEDGTGHIRIDIAEGDAHVIGSIGELAALMNIVYDGTRVRTAWSLNAERLPAVDITIMERLRRDADPGLEGLKGAIAQRL